ncbi:magnesium chelatase domain-containing protein [Embleya sp. NPDC001921]
MTESVTPREWIIIGRDDEIGYDLWDVAPVPTGTARWAFLEEIGMEVTDALGDAALKFAVSARDAVDQVLADHRTHRGHAFHLIPTGNLAAYGPITDVPGTARALAGERATSYLVEATSTPGPAAFTLDGFPDRASNEVRDRVRAAVVNSGRVWPDSRLTVTVTANLPRVDQHVASDLDLAIACTAMAAGGLLDPGCLTWTALFGELGLDGKVRLPGGWRNPREFTNLLRSLPAAGAQAILVPWDATGFNTTGIHAIGVRDLDEALSVLNRLRTGTLSGL